jgi:hypothetical protein
MQHLLLALSIVSLTVIAGFTLGKENKRSMVMKVEEQKPKTRSVAFPDEKFSVWYSRFDMIVN